MPNVRSLPILTRGRLSELGSHQPGAYQTGAYQPGAYQPGVYQYEPAATKPRSVTTPSPTRRDERQPEVTAATRQTVAEQGVSLTLRSMVEHPDQVRKYY